jgi:hypothetical protein
MKMMKPAMKGKMMEKAMPKGKAPKSPKMASPKAPKAMKSTKKMY